MISLSSATSNVRLLAKILVGVIALIIIGFLVFRLVTYFIESRRPPEAPEQGFGELPNIPFPESGAKASDFTYRLNTLDGKLPTLPDRLPVYTTVTPTADLLGLQDSRERMKTLGYSLGEVRLDKNLYQWTKESGEIVKYDILTHNFEIFSSYIFNPSGGTFSGDAENEIYTQIISLLTQLGVDIDTLKNIDDTVFTFYLIQNGQLVPIDRLSGAQIVRVDLLQDDLETQEFVLGDETITSLPIVYPIAGKSTMNFLLDAGRGSGRIVEAHFTQFPIDSENSSAYPLKTPEDAWEELKAGKAYIAKFDPNSPQVDILSVELGYFMGETDSGYAIPVMRFVGKDFEAYVDAVDRTPAETQEAAE